MTNHLISAVLQVLVFGLIPFIVYLVVNKKTKGFFEYVGLKKSNAKANFYAFLVSFIFLIPPLVMTEFNEEIRQLLIAPTTVTGEIRSLGFSFSTVIIVIIIAVFKTAFAEELFFRGFLAKRLMKWLGYQAGNILQALIFGAIHVFIFLHLSNNPFILGSILVVSGLGAYLSAHINEKMADGSLVPGWISHGIANLVSYSYIGFVMV
ncbi:MAG: CPBP family intramembrane glutamic endopeptidase [Bacteroidota bacterium]